MARVTFDWRSLKRWFLLFTFVMLAWLMWPVAKCSYGAFKATPLSEAQPHDPSGDPIEEPGFVSKVGGSIKACYRRTPLFKEDWKTYVLVGFAALTVFAYGMAYYEAGKKKSFEDG
jgi:hypothetical protein